MKPTEQYPLQKAEIRFWEYKSLTCLWLKILSMKTMNRICNKGLIICWSHSPSQSSVPRVFRLPRGPLLPSPSASSLPPLSFLVISWGSCARFSWYCYHLVSVTTPLHPLLAQMFTMPASWLSWSMYAMPAGILHQAVLCSIVSMTYFHLVVACSCAAMKLTTVALEGRQWELRTTDCNRGCTGIPTSSRWWINICQCHWRCIVSLA